MNISDAALKSVAFLGTKNGDQFLPRATCFFASYLEDDHPFDHLITAEHVIAGFLRNKLDIWLRVNMANGDTGEVFLDPAKFRFHPENAREAADVAVCPIDKIVRSEAGENVQMDATSIKLDGDGGFLPTAEFRNLYMGRGGTISIIGLFRSHSGTMRNIPIVRVGNISMLPEEPIYTSAGFIKAYLIEARSISGLSGSPVFAHPDMALELSKALQRQKTTQQACALVGLMSGHFDVPNLNEDVVTDENEQKGSVHTGIGVVVPVEKILETIRHPDLSTMRKAAAKQFRDQQTAGREVFQ